MKNFLYPFRGTSKEERSKEAIKDWEKALRTIKKLKKKYKDDKESLEMIKLIISVLEKGPIIKVIDPPKQPIIPEYPLPHRRPYRSFRNRINMFNIAKRWIL